jgi:hypothetical protein
MAARSLRWAVAHRVDVPRRRGHLSRRRAPEYETQHQDIGARHDDFGAVANVATSAASAVWDTRFRFRSKNGIRNSNIGRRPSPRTASGPVAPTLSPGYYRKYNK